MTEDATLDAFGGGSDGTPGDDADVADDAAGVADDAEPPEPAAPTSSWHPDGECAACGERAARRWWDGGERVCASCASWTVTGGDACDQ